MKNKSSIFKAYDIRGRYPDELDEGKAYDIAIAIAKSFNFSNVVIAHDARLSSPKISEAITYSLLSQGKHVILLGTTTTPLLYYATSKLNVDLGIMITASHNPREYNGIKLCKKNAIPVSYDTGINKIESSYNSLKKKTRNYMEIKNNFFKLSNLKLLNLKITNLIDDYKNFILSSLSYKKLNKKLRKVKVIIDAGNGVGGYILTPIINKLKLDVNFIDYVPLFFEPDGDFPNHQANPLEESTLLHLIKMVKESHADIGIAIDGDGDRIGIVDENGNFIQPDLLTALFSDYFLSNYETIYEDKKNSKTIIYDLRSSKIVRETIKKNHGNAIKSRVGHSYIKEIMRKNNAIFAGELSGHFYFRFNEGIYFDSGIKALLELLTIISMEDKPISNLILKYKKYYQSGEINFDVGNKQKIINKIKNYLQENEKCKIEEIDGLSMYFENYWFNLRPSNTENKLRLNLEADTKETLDKKLNLIETLIKRDK